ncbi:OLC1v1015378C1 [Oldenlandia corymbosa var. corymbosa]|uniref:OLC1v1015378C1 n=1 Tax=Oldenlandia corymbosa var. corymbosa TaxID=529605 RepID=A0AAV1E358_OLDCO|nr:OLC1v1015378C1 [Oldenlandia corymbosa var. corymbosa]
MEKKSLFFLVIILYITTFLCSSSTAQQPKPVVDIDGKPLRTSSRYYILPVIRGSGGGLTLSSSGNQTCPLYVAQDPLEVNFGLPVSFSPPKTSISGVVRVSSDVNIKFVATTATCGQSKVWNSATTLGINSTLY